MLQFIDFSSCRQARILSVDLFVKMWNFISNETAPAGDEKVQIRFVDEKSDFLLLSCRMP